MIDVKKIPIELKLITALTNLDEKNIDTVKIRNILKSNLEWDYFFDLALFHRVYPIVYKNIVKLDLKEVPKDILGRLRFRTNKNNLQMMKITAELVKVTALFDTEGIKSISVKGPALALKLYKNLNYRPSRDLDILIKEKDIKKAEKLLVDLGYKVEHRKEKLNDKEIADYMKKHRHFCYYHSEKRMRIELHWNLYYPSSHMTKEFDFNEFWRKKKEINISGHMINVFSDEDLFFILTLHGASHGWFRLRWLYDMVLFHKEIDIPNNKKILEAIRSNKIEDYVTQIYILSESLFRIDSNILCDFEKSNRAMKLVELAFEFIVQSKSSSEYNIFQRMYYIDKRYMFLLCRGFKGKLHYLKETISPQISEVQESKVPSYLYGIHFILRFTKFFGRQINKIKISLRGRK